MKLHFSKDWLRKKIEDGDDDGFCMAMSPRIYAYSRLTQYALIDPVARTIMHLYACEGWDYDFSRRGEDRLCWAVNRLERYLRRKNPDFERDSFMAQINNLTNRIDDFLENQ